MASEQSPTSQAASLAEDTAKEALCTWECACDLWSAYFRSLAAAPGPAGVLEANARLLADSLDLYEHAAGALLTRGGLRAPLLNDV